MENTLPAKRLLLKRLPVSLSTPYLQQDVVMAGMVTFKRGTRDVLTGFTEEFNSKGAQVFVATHVRN